MATIINMENIALLGSMKNISFTVNHPKIKSLFIQITEDVVGVPTAQIKFSINVGHTDAWFLVSSLEPLKVYGGAAGTYIECPENIFVESELTLMDAVLSWTPEKILDMAVHSKFIKEYSDFFN